MSKHVARAKAHRVTRLADRLRYCELALEHGESFAGEAGWQPVWKAMESGTLRLEEALEQVQPVKPDPVGRKAAVESDP